MNEIEITKLVKELTRLLQNVPLLEEGDEGELEEKVEKIKRELGSWFIEGYQLYQAS